MRPVGGGSGTPSGKQDSGKAGLPGQGSLWGDEPQEQAIGILMVSEGFQNTAASPVGAMTAERHQLTLGLGKRCTEHPQEPGRH